MTARVVPAPSRARRVPCAGPGARNAARGFALVVAMLVLVVVGLSAAAILRNALGVAQLANGDRLRSQASQSAQFALRLCETQLALAPGARSVALLPAATPAAWTARARWTATGPGAAHALTAAELGGAAWPRVPPQCLMEATDTAGVFTITARGFSADFRADPVPGLVRTGATVWLQETVYADGGAAAASAPASAEAPLVVRQRTWQRLLTPPF